MKSIVVNTLFLIYIVVLIDVLIPEVEATVFNFKRYPYKKKQKNERKYKGIAQRCDQNPECAAMTGLDQMSCIRDCVSPKCYDEIYAWDELEDGEIDVRFSSFKGCVLANEQITL